MPKQKWKPPRDPMSDLELRLCDIETLGELLIEAIDNNKDDHVAYLADQLPRHVGDAKRFFEAAFKERCELRELLKPKEPPPRPMSPKVKAASDQFIAALREHDREQHLSIVPSQPAN